MADPEETEVDPEAPEVPTQAVYPRADGAGGTKYVYGDDEGDATYEEWALQNGVEVQRDEDGNVIDPSQPTDPEATPQRRTDDI